jgi:hypothetical protein
MGYERVCHFLDIYVIDDPFPLERMRNNYGKMIYLLQDANMRDVAQHFGFSCIRDIHTVHSFLEARDALDLLEDPRIHAATRSIANNDSRHELDLREDKAAAIASLCAQYGIYLYSRCRWHHILCLVFCIY